MSKSFPVRRRAHGSDDEDEDRGQQEPKRYRREQEVEDRLEEVVLRIGESDNKTPSSITESLQEAITLLESEMGDHKAKIKELLLECAAQVPEKMTIYSTLLGLLNAKNYSFGGDVVEGLVNNLLSDLRSCKFESALNTVIFLSNLVNCRVIAAQSFLALLDNFMAVTVEQGIPQGRSDWYTYAILCSLPYVGKEFAENHATVLEQLLEGIVSYLNKRDKNHVPLIRVWSTNKPHPQEEYLDCLWAQIDKLRTDAWEEHHIPRYHTSFDNIFGEALQHNLPAFVPPPHTETSIYPPPRVVFRLFDYTDCPEDGPVLPGSHSIERFLIEQDLNWILSSFHLERKNCAAALVSYSHRGKVPLNYMILEIIFGQLYHLPKPPYLELFYGSLLIELCKLQPNSMPQVLAQAAEMLYQRIDNMQVMCVDRFVDWFAYHLSNFQFRWSWDDWSDCLTLEPLKPKQLFVREVLVKCMRLSYHQRVADIMPATFSPLLPPKPEPNFKYSRDGAQNLPGTSIAQQLARRIREKCTPEEALELLEKCPNPSGNEKSNPLKVDVLLSTLLHLGSKSFSHSFAALAKYHIALKSLTEKDSNAEMVQDDEPPPVDPQLVLLESLYELWSSHTQMLVVIVDKLLKMQIVECEAVVKFVFSDSLKEDFLRMYVWEILFSATSKLTRHVDKLRKDVREAKAKLERGEPMQSEEDKDAPEPPGEEGPTSLPALESKLAGAEEVQRTMFLTLFQKFVVLLTEYLLQCETEGINFNTDYYRLAMGRLRQTFLQHPDEVAKHVVDLETHLFSHDCDPHLLEVFHQFCALHH